MSNETARSPHTLNWFEIPVTDMDRAVALYSAVIDGPLKLELFGGVPNAVFPRHADGAVTGALICDPKRPPVRGGGTTIYLNVPGGVAPALGRAREAGATVVLPVTDIGPFGTIALIADRDGNVVGLHTPKA